MKRSLLTLTVAATVGVGSLFTGVAANSAIASSKLQELQNKKNELQRKRSGVESGINKADQEINRLQNEQEKVIAEIKRLDLAIGDTNEKINEKNVQIAETKAEIEKLRGEIAVLQERIKKRDAMLKERARSFQETGGMVSYIDVLMGAQSFSDFIDRVGAVATFVEADQEILREHMKDKALLEEKQAKVEKDLAELEKMLAELENMKNQLNSQKAEKDRLMSTLKKQEEHKHTEKLALEEEKEVLAAQEAAMQKAIQLEKQRLAELERQRQAQAQKRSSGGSGGTVSNGGGGGSNLSTPPVSSGMFMKPANGRFSSGFGPRDGELHAGIDIANSANVPVVAAADGVVIRSYYSSSYGNCIFISHSINGQIYTTVYAHLQSRLVGTGAVVSKGQQIGVMGNTGYSFGQHLHFEIHKGPWNPSKSNAVDPLNYISM
ncbi:peptidase M23 [Bacillus methanolicus]|uniref:murein hydrolase activator EnvC family protein n=1 Tax=Bacillus methanolicus TaxID=1471 RepID=UPI0023801A18|nr:peptidoglycan DD-metalloendopeptidase family protein [Bacillus methanolicus]MDE3840124.1 peptidase M23 [Bacillus methanolicus]